MTAVAYVTEISVTASEDRNGWRLCSGMREPEPLPEPELEAEASL